MATRASVDTTSRVWSCSTLRDGIDYIAEEAKQAEEQEEQLLQLIQDQPKTLPMRVYFLDCLVQSLPAVFRKPILCFGACGTLLTGP